MTITDGFAFFNELDILKIRLEELYPVVDRFVLVESNLTFRGNPKPYYYEENKTRYAQYADKIVHIKLVDNNTYNDDYRKASWEREYWQRNQISQGIQDLDPDDIIIVSDVDEIPRRSAIAELNPEPLQRFIMKEYYYAINMYAGGAGASKATRKKYFTTAQQTRETDPPGIENGGWHFSYIGDALHIQNKLKSFSHWELDIPEVTDLDKLNERMNSSMDLWGSGHHYQIVPVDESYPEEVKDNLSYYKKYIR